MALVRKVRGSKQAQLDFVQNPAAVLGPRCTYFMISSYARRTIAIAIARTLGHTIKENVQSILRTEVRGDFKIHGTKYF